VFNLFRRHAGGLAVPALTRRVTGNMFLFAMHKEDVMLGFRKIMVVVLLIAALSIGPVVPAAFADEYAEREKPTGGMMMWDTLVMRPIGIVATAAGSVIWLVSYPFAYWGDNTDQSTQMLVEAPFEWTFDRPLGHF
jgi:hypothetical protein